MTSKDLQGPPTDLFNDTTGSSESTEVQKGMLKSIAQASGTGEAGLASSFKETSKNQENNAQNSLNLHLPPEKQPINQMTLNFQVGNMSADSRQGKKGFQSKKTISFNSAQPNNTKPTSIQDSNNLLKRRMQTFIDELLGKLIQSVKCFKGQRIQKNQKVIGSITSIQDQIKFEVSQKDYSQVKVYLINTLTNILNDQLSKSLKQGREQSQVVPEAVRIMKIAICSQAVQKAQERWIHGKRDDPPSELNQGFFESYEGESGRQKSIATSNILRSFDEMPSEKKVGKSQDILYSDLKEGIKLTEQRIVQGEQQILQGASIKPTEQQVLLQQGVVSANTGQVQAQNSSGEVQPKYLIALLDQISSVVGIFDNISFTQSQKCSSYGWKEHMLKIIYEIE